jgi:hypothetical protein
MGFPAKVVPSQIRVHRISISMEEVDYGRLFPW